MRRKIISIDFDGCLCTNKWPDIGDPNPIVIQAAINEKKNGSILILSTHRVGKQLADAIELCRSRGVEFDMVNENHPQGIKLYGIDCRKIIADEYWSDNSRWISHYGKTIVNGCPMSEPQYIPITIIADGKSIPTLGLMDTGAECSCISLRIIEKLGLRPCGTTTQFTPGGSRLANEFTVDIRFADSRLQPRCGLRVIDFYSKGGNCEAIIGLDILANWHIVWDGPASVVHIIDTGWSDKTSKN